MNQFRSFISQYASNAAERVACHYKERSLTFQIVASRVLSCASSSPPADSIRPAVWVSCVLQLLEPPERACTARCTVTTELVCANSRTQNTFCWGVAILRLTRQMLWAAGRIELAGGEEGAQLSTLLATIWNVKLRSLYGMRLFPRRCLCTAKLVHFLWRTWYNVTVSFLWSRACEVPTGVTIKAIVLLKMITNHRQCVKFKLISNI
jgi:hypothetical protein